MHIAALLLFFGLIFAITLVHRAEVHIATLAWFRALIPSWRFFDSPGDEPLLFYRIQAPGAWGHWQPVFSEYRSRRVLDVFYNPEATMRLALHSLLEKALVELNEAASAEVFANGASYALLKNVVEFRLKEQKQLATCFQFRVVTKSFPSGELEERLVSSEHVVEADV